MAGFGLGFGTGFFNRLARNQAEDKLLRLKEAELRGDILGMQGELPAGEQSPIPTDTAPESGLTNILSTFGLGGSRLPQIEQMTTQKAMLVRQVARYRAKLAEYKGILEQVRKGELDLAPEDESRLIEQAPGFLKMMLPAAFNKIRQEKAAKEKFAASLRGIQKRTEIPSTIETEPGDYPLGGGISSETVYPSGHEIAASAVETFGEKAVPHLERLIEGPKAEKPERPFGSSTTGFFERGPGGVRQIVPPKVDPLLDVRRRNLESQIEVRRNRENRLKEATNLVKDPKVTLGQLSASLNALIRERDSLDTPKEDKAEINLAINSIRRRMVELGKGSVGGPLAPKPKDRPPLSSFFGGPK